MDKNPKEKLKLIIFIILFKYLKKESNAKVKLEFNIKDENYIMNLSQKGKTFIYNLALTKFTDF